MEQQAEYGTTMTISSLKAADYNPRKIEEENFTALTYSIKEFGDLSGITFNRTTGNLVTGHQRVRSLMEQYGTDLPIVKNGILLPDGSHFHVRFVDWDLQKEVAANIAANNPNLQGEFTVDLQKLLMNLEQDSNSLWESLAFDKLYDEDKLFDSVRIDLAGYDPRKHSSTDEYELGGKYQDKINYNLVFNNKDDKDIFESFVERARTAHPEAETIATAVVQYIKLSGL